MVKMQTEKMDPDATNTEYARAVARAFLPGVLFRLLKRGLIDVEKRHDPAYLWSVVLRDGDWDKFEATTVIHESFLEVAKYAIAHDKREVAVVLIVTAVEHVLNCHYSDLLLDEGLSHSEIREVLRNTRIAEKKGWLLSITDQERLPKELGRRIDMLVELRNTLVHYKPMFVPFGRPDEWCKIESRITSLDFDELLTLPTELERALETGRRDHQQERQMVHEMYEIMMSSPTLPR